MTSNDKFNFIQIYASNVEENAEEIENVYSVLHKTLPLTTSRYIIRIMGDFNAKIGEGIWSSSVGPFELGVHNDRGESLKEFRKERDLVITKSCFKLP